MNISSSHEELPNPVDRLVDTYYDQLWRQGLEARVFNPAVWLGGIATGDVVWRVGESFGGYAVSTFSYSGLFPEDVRERASLGFSEDMQRKGVWTLRRVRVQRNGSEYERAEDVDMTWAHYNGRRWHVARTRQDLDPEGWPFDSLTDFWEAPSADLHPRQKEVIARVARDTELILDVAASLTNRQADYTALKQALVDRARASKNEQQVGGIETLLKPWRYEFPNTSYYYPTMHQLPALATTLYRALVGEVQRDALSVRMIRDIAGVPGAFFDISQPIPIKEGTICPPYEPVDLTPGTNM